GAGGTLQVGPRSAGAVPDAEALIDGVFDNPVEG
ncbi:MAG: hypothetical protein RLZZ93_767, partial [Actinomycetota bacterium]